MNVLLVLIILFIVINFIIEKCLDFLNLNQWKKPLPEEIKDLYKEDEFEKAKAYNYERDRFGNITDIFSFTITLLMLIFGGFAIVHNWSIQITSIPLMQSLVFFGILFIASDIIGIPFSLYSVFKIEERYGFNKMTPKLFFIDKIKSYVLTILVGGSILSAFIWFYQVAGKQFWIYAWILFTGFTLFFTVFYTSLIVPLFNKLKPLEEGSLRQKIEAFAQKVSFPLTNVFVIDGSKRSTKANAYFSGIGKKKSIVLYDTLMKDHSEEELVGILAHEVGHYKKNHIIQGFLISTIQMGIMLFVLSKTIDNPLLSQALGVENPAFHIGLLAFSLLYSPISMILGTIMNLWSRSNEYEADNYAKNNYAAAPLISALKKLSTNHLSNLNPHPAYVFMNYSHPPLLARIKNLLN